MSMSDFPSIGATSLILHQYVSRTVSLVVPVNHAS